MGFHTIEEANRVGLVKYYLIYVLIDCYTGYFTEEFAIVSPVSPTNKSCSSFFTTYGIDQVIGVTGAIEISGEEYDKFWKETELKPIALNV